MSGAPAAAGGKEDYSGRFARLEEFQAAVLAKVKADGEVILTDDE